jgi:hypothetical protein
MEVSMQLMNQKGIQGIVLILFLVVFVSCAFAAQKQKSPDSGKNPEAMYYLRYMAEYLAGAKQLQVRITSGYDVMQSSGQKIEFREDRRLTMIRPDKLRVDVERDDGRLSMVIFDGNSISAYDLSNKIMAVTSRPGDIDNALKYFIKDLKMRVPLALLFTAGFPAELERRVLAADVVQKVVLSDVPCLQIAARDENVDFQVWIPEKEEPLPRRIIITYKKDEGQPQFRADLSHWSTVPNIPESNFNFVPPDGTERIPFLAEIPNVSGVSKKKGGKR